MRFFYYYPTWNKPSGGNKQIRLMASLLTGLGVETFLLRDRRFFAPGGFDDHAYYRVPVSHAALRLRGRGGSSRAGGHSRPA